ncbi:MAG TPA: FmdB family zinc ribbon protein [Limnochordia bacterium]|nr:FmdB family zinc ribbon protein [Limnochordia bacterium]
MPVYEYKCPNCGRFEVTQSIKADALKSCPTCEASVERLISRNVGIIFKGSGFYITDSRKGSGDGAKGGGEGKSGAAGEAKSDAKGEAKSESKSEAKSESKKESAGASTSA